MPLSYLVLMILAVILAAGLTVWLLQMFGAIAFALTIPVGLIAVVAIRALPR